MQGFPYWPAASPPGGDRQDIHRLRAEHFLFVRFYGWRANAAHLWSMLITCCRGTRAWRRCGRCPFPCPHGSPDPPPHPSHTRRSSSPISSGLLNSKIAKKTRDVELQRAKREALASSQRGAAPKPPPWWMEHLAGAEVVAEAMAATADEGEGEGEAEGGGGEEEEEASAAEAAAAFWARDALRPREPGRRAPTMRRRRRRRARRRRKRRRRRRARARARARGGARRRPPPPWAREAVIKNEEAAAAARRRRRPPGAPRATRTRCGRRG